MYEREMRQAFQWQVTGTPERLRELAAKLLEPEPDFIAKGSSFALTVRPQWILWLSDASCERLRVDGLLNQADLHTGDLARTR